MEEIDWWGVTDGSNYPVKYLDLLCVSCLESSPVSSPVYFLAIMMPGSIMQVKAELSSFSF